MHIRHIAIRVRDLERSVAFYEGLAGLKVARRLHSGPAELAFLANAAGETEIELIQMPGQTYEGKGWFLCFETKAIDERHAFALETGLNPSPIQEPGDGTRYFYAYDPDGLSVQLRSFPG